jgi:hypothetical protein
MAEENQLVPAAPTLPVSYYEQRLEESRIRLRNAVARVKSRARELTPAARISRRPVRWVLGGFAVGVVLGWWTAPRRY